MPKTIKTRDVVKDIKILDKSANLSERMKDSFVRTKDMTEETQSARDATPTEYASGNIQTTARSAAADAAHRLPNAPHKVSENISRATTREDGLAADVVIIDEDRAQKLIEVFGDMCEISYEVIVHRSESVNDAGETTLESRVLHIYTTSKTYEDMPDFYGFSQKQTELSYEIMEMRDLLAEVICRHFQTPRKISLAFLLVRAIIYHNRIGISRAGAFRRGHGIG